MVFIRQHLSSTPADWLGLASSQSKSGIPAVPSLGAQQLVGLNSREPIEDRASQQLLTVHSPHATMQGTRLCWALEQNPSSQRVRPETEFVAFEAANGKSPRAAAGHH